MYRARGNGPWAQGAARREICADVCCDPTRAAHKKEREYSGMQLLLVCAGGRNGRPSTNYDNSLPRYVTRIAAANLPRPCRCRVIRPRIERCSLTARFLAHRGCSLPSPCAKRSRRQHKSSRRQMHLKSESDRGIHSRALPQCVCSTPPTLVCSFTRLWAVSRSETVRRR
jgi:hypothetical protein